MAKKFKQYINGKWTNISDTPQDIIIDVVYSGDTELSDEHVRVNNYNYAVSGKSPMLTEALSVISDDISRLQRNVSWLAEHGGGGGAGSGGTAAFGIVLYSPDLDENKIYYTSADNLIVQFAITGGTSADRFQYRYIYDGVYTSQYSGMTGSETATINVRNIHMVSTASTHTFKIEAYNADGYGANIVPFSFRVYESSLVVSVDVTGNTIKNGEIIVSKDDSEGWMFFNVRNGILQSETTLYATIGTETTGTTYINDVSSPKSIGLKLWDLINRYSVQTGYYYDISLYARATNGSVTVVSDKITVGIRISSANEMIIYFNGITYKNDVESGITSPTEIENGNNLRFSFNVSLPTNVTNKSIYYAIKLYEPGQSEGVIIYGNTFNDSEFNTNVAAFAKEDITIQYPLGDFQVKTGYTIDVKAWTYNGQLSALTSGVFSIISANNEIFPRQYNKRSGNSSVKDTCLLTFNKSSRFESGKWVSYVNEYWPLTGPVGPVSANMSLFNINGRDSGYKTPIDDAPYIRLQNEAYASVDLTEHKTELDAMINPDTTNAGGFTISVTFKVDETPTKEKTIFLFGTNDVNGTLINGIRIDGETATWQINANNAHTLKGFVRQGIKNTVDFTYENGIACIYINGISCASQYVGDFDVSTPTYTFPNIATFACNVVNGNRTWFSDVNVYEFSLYTKVLSPIQVVVNGKNAKLSGSSSEESVIADYRQWKVRNFIYSTEEEPDIARSYLITNGQFHYDYSNFEELKSITPIPIVTIDAQNSDFTREIFHKKYEDSKITATTWSCTFKYYDPITKNTIELISKISLQGTSTLQYYVKNLELIIDEPTSDGVVGKKKLFQPKAEWFPENEFTLKADVVDSSHANNTTIGEWINGCGILENNPAMDALTDANRPQDICNGVTYSHIDSRDPITSITYDEKVTIKHNLEGFPVILFITFARETVPELVGIYSFNLGRFSYYNMGMSFLKSFSRRDKDNPGSEKGCPAVVDYYEEYNRSESFGGIPLNGIFAYEFGAAGDDNDLEHMTWSQSDKSILRFYGSFRFNGENPSAEVADDDAIWNKLSSLFAVTASITGNTLNSRGFDLKYRYTYDDEAKKFVSGNTKYDPIPSPGVIENYLSIGNAGAYFIIANAFGMIDSLGKNMTLRTWDNGTKWWPCFYDMDTALGLTNEGAEDISESALIDKYEPGIPITENSGIIYHTSLGQYNAFNSKLWAILRDPNVLYSLFGDPGKKIYEPTWTSIRKVGGSLASYSAITDLMEEQTSGCGELLYDYDYYSKYISDTSNSEKLHGLRIEYVRNWLKNRLYFLDGVFEDEKTYDFLDSPFYNDNVSITNRGHVDAPIGYIPYTFRSVANTFVKINTGSGTENTTQKFFIPSYQNVSIQTSEHTSQKQTVYNSTSLLSKFDGLTGINVVSFGANADNGRNLPTLVTFSISGTKILSNDPIDVKKMFMNVEKESMLEEFDISNTNFSNPGGELRLDFSGFTKLKKINISNSPTTSINFPSSVLSQLLIKNSAIPAFKLASQPILTDIDFTGCTKLITVDINDCNALTGLTFAELAGLQTITIQNCNSLESVVIQDCNSVNSVIISNCPSLKSLSLTSERGIANEVNFEITSCSNLSSLTINNLYHEQIVKLDTATAASIKSLNFDSFYGFSGFSYNGGAVKTYDGGSGSYFVVDLSPMVQLKTASFGKNNLIRYVEFNNSEDRAFDVDSSTFYNCFNLERVFGHINICSGGIFARLQNFKINDDYGEYTGYTSKIGAYFDWDYATNIEIDTPSLYEEFASTNCDLEDVYYVFSKINSGVTSIERMFQFCNNIRIDQVNPDGALDAEMCDGCTAITNINYLFYGCENMKCYVPAEITRALTKSATEFRYVFPNGTYFYNTVPFNENNHITIIDGFNPIYGDGPGTDVNVVLAEFLLSGLTSLVTINESFNTIPDKGILTIDFSNELRMDDPTFTNPYYSNLLKGLTKLKVINNCFNGVTSRSQAIRGLICNPNELEYYSSGITSIANSFNIDSNGKYMNALFIGNSMFENCRDSLTTIAGSFNGTITKILDTTDCTSAVTRDNVTVIFPYEIFSGMSKLKSVDSFFYCLHLTKSEGYTDEEQSEYEFTRLRFSSNLQTIELPSYTDLSGNTRSIFEDCVSLESASSAFKCLCTGDYYLTPYGFSGTKIQDVSHIFEEKETLPEKRAYYEYFRGHKKGSIPHHLFYSENCGLRNLISAFEGSDGTGLTSYTLPAFTDPNDYLDGDGKVNIYLHDGTAALSAICVSEGWEIPVEITENTEAPLMETIFPSTVRSEAKIAFLGYDYHDSVLSRVYLPRNYFCPPDLFRYCVNDETVQIDNIFRDCSAYIENYGGPNFIVHGYYGRIPSYLFRPISNIQEINGVFGNFRLIVPEIWPSNAGSVNGTLTADTGEMYPILFDECFGLVKIDSVFEGSTIIGFTLADNLFKDKDPLNPNETLSSSVHRIISLWKNAVWNTNADISASIFSRFVDLNSVYGIFENSGPKTMYPTLFNNTMDSIVDCSRFMYNSVTREGSIIPFWLCKYLRTFGGAYYNVALDVSSIPSEYTAMKEG